MSRPTRLAAVDLGASSGRVMAADVTEDQVELTEVHRFTNGPVHLGDTLHWNVLGLYSGVLQGLRKAAGNEGHLDAVGIDSWGVDYGLLDVTGALLGNPVHHRDKRTDGIPAAVHALIPPAELYAATGAQVLEINTIYQLHAAADSPQLRAARQLLLMPDLLGYWLTGERIAEVTNASTTGLLDPRTRTWCGQVARTLGIDPELFAPLVEPGTTIGGLAPHVCTDTGVTGDVPLVAVGSHDTASAVAGIPARTEQFAFVATGTWSLVGVELDAPVLSEAGRTANFSNELGVDGTVRYLRNVMGLWLLQECLRAWGNPDLAPLLDAAAERPALAAVIDAGDARFLPPGDMPTRIAAACEQSGQRSPTSRAGTVRCILDSLALAHRRSVHQAADLSGHDVDTIHVVGGGARNALLCQLTADACDLPVVAGPTEAAAYGNALIQARGVGAIHGDLSELRTRLHTSTELTRYEPRGNPAAWDGADKRL